MLPTRSPPFWSRQHGVKIQSAGMPALGDTTTVIADTLARRRLLTAHTRHTPDGPVLVGLIAFDHTQALNEATPLIGQLVTTGQAVPA